MTSRLLPANEDAERGLLCCLLIALRQTACLVIERGCAAPWFHSPANRAIFAALMMAWQQGGDLDLITFTNFLRSRGELDAVGGPAYVTELFIFIPSAAFAGNFLDSLRDCYLRRELITQCLRLAERGHDATEDAQALVLEAAQSIAAVGHRREAGKTTARDHLLDLLDDLVGKNESEMLETGIIALDELTGGWGPGNLVIIGGETKSGKTALMLNIIERNVIRGELSAVIFSLEMSGKENIGRILSSMARVDGMEMRRRRVSVYDMDRIRVEGGRILDSRLHVVCDARTLPELHARATQFHAQRPLDIICLDYIQLLGGVSKEGENREREVASVSRGMKALAERLGCVVIALSQLNENGKLRESRAIGQDANCVIGIENNEKEPGKKFLRVVAQRSGPSGDSIPCTWLPKFCRFENPAHQSYENQ